MRSGVCARHWPQLSPAPPPSPSANLPLPLALSACLLLVFLLLLYALSRQASKKCARMRKGVSCGWGALTFRRRTLLRLLLRLFLLLLLLLFLFHWMMKCLFCTAKCVGDCDASRGAAALAMVIFSRVSFSSVCYFESPNCKVEITCGVINMHIHFIGTTC